MKTSVVAILGGAALLASAYGDITETVAHWSYDAPTLTIAAGSITGVLDATGDHNATPGSGIGSATVANGGPTFTSNPIPANNSIPGRFGEALTLTGFNNAAGGGGQFLMFPDIKEIMAANGAPNYTVSMWVNTTNTSFNVFAGLSEWGNAATTPGRFAYGFGPGTPTQMRGQTRFDAGTNGTDIYARSVTTAPINDANWHMLTWTFETNTGTLRSYFDGALVDTFTSAAASFQMVTSSSTFGSLGFKGDTGNFINGSITFDEMYVFLGAATDSEVQNLFSLNVIPEPGSMALTGLGAIFFGVSRHRRMSAVAGVV